MKNKTTLGIIFAVLAAFAFGAYPAASRAVYADGGNAIFMMIVTTWARASLLTIFCLSTGKKIFSNRRDVTTALRGGFFQAASVLGIFASLNYLPGPIVIIIIFTHTLMLLFFMAWRKEIKLDTLTITTTLCALIGLGFVLDIMHHNNITSWIGIAFAFMAAIATMSRLYVYGQLTKTREPAIVGAESFIFAAIFISMAAFYKTPALPVMQISYLWTLMACLSLALGTFVMFYSIAAIGSFNYSIIAKLEPIFTAIFSFILIREVLNWYQYFGIIIVVTSLISYQYMTYKKAKR